MGGVEEGWGVRLFTISLNYICDVILSMSLTNNHYTLSNTSYSMAHSNFKPVLKC